MLSGQSSSSSGTRSIGFSFHLGGLGVKPCSPDVVSRPRPSATVCNRSRMIALWLCQWGSAERVSLMTCDVQFSLALCANRSFSSSTCHFAAHILKMQSECKVNPLRTLDGSNRSCCGAAHILKMQSELSAHFGWVKSLSLRRAAHFELAK